MHWVTGNGERDVVAMFDRAAAGAGDAARHNAAAITRADRDTLAAWPPTVTLGPLCVCHGSPRDVDEILTRDTPPAILHEAVAGIDASLVVGGHTHQQMIRPLPGGPDYANAGSIGMPYEGVAAAFWMLVDGAAPQPRRTDYDVEAAIERMRTGGYPGLDDLLEGALGPLVDPGWVSAYFEHGAGRGPDPGPERYIT
jgi:predicted phosphodiesterase